MQYAIASRTALCVVLCAGLMSFGGCPQEDQINREPTSYATQRPRPEQTGIRVEPGAITLRTVGETALLRVLASFSTNLSTTIERDVTASPLTTYETSDPTRVVVSPEGVVAAVEEGGAIVTVRNREFSFAVPVDVVLPNRAPVLGDIGARTVDLGTTLRFRVTASDPDGDALIYYISPLPLPANAGFNLATQEFTFRPMPDQVGTFNITFSATDGFLTDSEVVPITVNPVPPDGQTLMSGRLLDTNDFVQGRETPIVGAKVSLLGSGETASSDADGRFRLGPLPQGGVLVFDIDSSTAQPAPDGSPYCGFREGIELIGSVNNVIDRPFFLPRIDISSLTTVNPNETTVVHNPNLGITLTVAPQTARSADGTPFSGQLSISPVPQALAPAALPEHLSPGLLITIQPVGVTFAQPAPITLPNTDNLPPGTEADLWSLDPARGTFSVFGTLRVGSDGSRLETIAGGVRAADWHGALPPEPGGEDDDGNDETDEDDSGCPTGSRTSLRSGRLTVDHTLVGYRSMGQSRTWRLVYNSTAANVQPLISARTTILQRGAVPRSISTRLAFGGIDQGAELYTSTAGLSEERDETIRNVVQFAGHYMPTGVYPYRLRLTSNYPSTRVAAIAGGAVLVRNERQSAIGAGWTMAGVDRIHLQSNGNAVLAEGSGTTKHFRSVSGSDDVIRGTVGGRANIFGAGHASAPGPNGGGGGILPSEFRIDGLEGSILSFQSVAGTVSCCGGGCNNGPDGGGCASGNTAIQSFGGISGIIHTGRTMFLVGVFLSDAEPRNPAPTRLNFSNEDDFESITPQLNQTFFVGDGLTGRGSGLVQQFVVPPGATRVFFGFADAAEFGNPDFPPGYYNDNTGQIEVAFTVAQPSDFIFETPNGDFSKLIRMDDGGFERRFKDGTIARFDAGGMQTEIVSLVGAPTRFAYDDRSRLVSITDPANFVTRFAYSGDWLSSIEDPAGRFTYFEHDGRGCLTRIVDPDQTDRWFTYDNNFKMTNQVSKKGQLTAYQYGAAGENLGASLPDNTTRTVKPARFIGLVDLASGFGTASNPAPLVRPEAVRAEYVDGDGKRSTYKLDRFGHVLQSVDALDRTTDIARNADGLAESIEQPNGRNDRLTYDAKGNLIRLDEAIGTSLARRTTYDYHPTFAKVARIIDPSNKVTSLEYDADGRLIRTTNPLSGARVRTYIGETDLVATTADENGHTTVFAYDAAGLLDSVTDAENSETEYERDNRGNVLSVTEGLGTPEARTRSFTYDIQNRVLTATDGEGGVTTFRYDAKGNLLETQNPTGQIVRRIYDDLDRVIRVDDPVRGVTTMTYDGRGNLKAQTDALGALTQFFYDDAGQLIRSIDALGGVEQYDYDEMGNVTAFTDALNHTTAFQYDRLNRRTRRTNPLGQFATFGYDSRDNLTTQVTPNGATITNTYDDLSRLTRTTTPDNTITYTYDAVGNLLTCNDNDSRLSYTYDDVNRVQTANTLAGGVQPVTTIRYFYDAAGNRIRMEDSEGGVTLYDYDNVGRLRFLTTPSSDVIEETYDPAGRLDSIAYPNGITADYQYDGATGRLMRLRHASSSSTLLDFQYAYNSVSNITQIAEPADTRNFTYDALQRLRTGGTAALPEFYDYDAVGNRTASHLSASHVHDAANRLLQDDSFDYTYDANGNLQTKTDRATSDVTTYSWSAQNQLVRIDFADGTNAEYRYDGIGRRIERLEFSITEQFVYDRSARILGFNGQHVLTLRFVQGARIDDVMAVHTQADRFILLNDHLGSVRLAIDSTHNALANDYDSFGRPLAPLSGVLATVAYIGREPDAAATLLHLRARSYYSVQYIDDTAGFL